MNQTTANNQVYQALCWLEDRVAKIQDLTAQLSSLPCPVLEAEQTPSLNAPRPVFDAGAVARGRVARERKSFSIGALAVSGILIYIYVMVYCRASWFTVGVCPVLAAIFYSSRKRYAAIKMWLSGIGLVLCAFGLRSRFLYVLERDWRIVLLLAAAAAVLVAGNVILTGRKGHYQQIAAQRARETQQENERLQMDNERRMAGYRQKKKQKEEQYFRDLRQYQERCQSIQNALAEVLDELKRCAPDWYWTCNLSLDDIQRLCTWFEQGAVTTWKEAVNKLDDYYNWQRVHQTMQYQCAQQAEQSRSAMAALGQVLGRMQEMARSQKKMLENQGEMIYTQQELLAGQREMSSTLREINSNIQYIGSQAIREIYIVGRNY